MPRIRKNILRLIALCSAVIITSTSLSACRPREAIDGSNTDYCQSASDNASTSPTVESVAVIAPTSNFVDFKSIVQVSQDAVSKEMGSELSDQELTESRGRELSVVIADGAPKLAGMRIVDPKGSAVSDFERQIKTTTAIYGDIADCAAGDLKRKYDQIETVDETNLLGALSIAADQLNNSSSKKVIFVLANGYQTSGAIKMQDEGNFPKTKKYADLLAKGLLEIGALPDLKEARVVWYGMGQTYSTELDLDQNSRYSLSYFWQKIISMSNGVISESDVLKQVGSGSPNKNAIKVTSGKIQPCNLLITLYESDGVHFKPNSKEFLSRKAAVIQAKNVAKKFNASNCDHLTVHGFAASGVDQDTYESKKTKIDNDNAKLTLARAKAFGQLLRTNGFSGEISYEGDGTCEGDQWTENGLLDEALQKLCRRVEVSN